MLWRLMPGGKSKAVLAAEQTLAVQHVLEDKNRQVIALENQADELSALRAQLSARQNQLTNLQLEVAALEGGSQQDLRLEMVHLGTDPRGIARSGALLTFMGSEHPPRLHESATGRVSCYYRDVAGQLMVGYYESLVRRAQWELPTEQDPLILDSRLTRSQADQTTLVVTDGDRSETCRLTIENPTLSVREVWPELPRELADATQVLGGVHPSYDYSRATVEPADKTLRAGSLLIRPLQGPASASLVNGGAHLAHSGHCNHWIGDSPGQAYYFNGRSHHVCAPNNRLEEVGLTDDFTLELWANPLLNYESAHIVHQRGQNSGYVLGLDPALIRAALQLNGTDEYVHAAI
ncbi:MAG: hypothetical protein ACPG77_17065, partial [Nannocystaceae bacterium]